jgi:hypothetical protein
MPDLVHFFWPSLNCLRVARRARSVLVQQLDGPGLPCIVVVGAGPLDCRARRGQCAIEGCFCWQLRLRRRGCARTHCHARNQLTLFEATF